MPAGENAPPSQGSDLVGSTDDECRIEDKRFVPNEKNQPSSNSSKSDGLHKVEDNGHESNGDDNLTSGAMQYRTGTAINGFREVSAGEGGKGEVSDEDYAPTPLPPRSWLAEPYLRILLFLHGLYSVREEVYPACQALS